MSLDVWGTVAVIAESLRPLREAAGPDALAAVDLVDLRAKLRVRLEQLRGLLAGRHSERDAYFVLFPLVAHYDELVKTLVLDLHHLQWPPIQQELYQVADAGDLFYETLDSVLGKPDTLPLVYEMYYFCLEDGFRGRYGANPDKLDEYRQKLREQIRPAVLEALPPQRPTPPRRAPLRLPSWVWYGAAAAILLAVYAVLSSMADVWQPVG
jgi:type IV/VI secretion system ImpK/VasF family protein